MDSKTFTQQTGQARGNLMRQEQQLRQANGNLDSAIRNRIVGGVILLIGVFAIIQLNAIVGGVILLIGGWVFVKALRTIGQERRSIDTITNRVATASAKLDELQAQPPEAE